MSNDKSAKTLAEYFDYPWDYMPEQGRENLRKIAAKLVADAVAEEREACAKIAERAVAHPMMPVAGIAMRISERSNL